MSNELILSKKESKIVDDMEDVRCAGVKLIEKLSSDVSIKYGAMKIWRWKP